MAGSGDIYRLKAADVLARAQCNPLIREELDYLAKAYLRLAEHADRNARMAALRPDPQHPVERQDGHQAVQQQQPPQPKARDDEDRA